MHEARNAKRDLASSPDSTDSFWRDWAIWILVVAAFAVRIAYNLALHPDGHPPKTFVIDEREYYGAAHMLYEGRGFSFFDSALWVRPPLYVASLAGAMMVGGDGYLPALVFQSLLSALTLPALGWLAFRAGGRKAARWSVLLGLLYLPLTLFAGLLLSETLFVFLFAWSLVALVLAREALGNDSSSLLRLLKWPALAGLLLGLGVLTRSTALGFLPLAMLWLAWDKAVLLRQRIISASVLLAVCLLALLPWIARNYATYGRFIPVDTTGGYNLWLGSVGVRDEERLQADLLAIENPGERQSYALTQALSTIAADPIKFVGKGIKESFDLWLPSFGAEERQVKAYTLGRIPDWHLLSLFLFDDLLYLAILLISILGLSISSPNALKSLTGLWVLLWVVMSFVFFAVTRFRLPIVVALIPWAGVGISLLPQFRTLATLLPRRTQIASVVAALAALLVIAPALPLYDTWLGIERWGQQSPYRSAENLLRSGQPEQAITEYRRANTELSDTRYGLAAALIQVGQTDQALAQLRPDDDPDRFEPHIIRGEIARKAGNLDAARSSFNARVVQVQSELALDWAWDHLRPADTTTLEIGSGLDIGYIRGFYQSEIDKDGIPFRWSTTNPEIRWSGTLSGATFTWNGWRPLSSATATLRFLPSASGTKGVLIAYEKQFPNTDVWADDKLYDLIPATNSLPENGDCLTYSCFSIKINGFVGAGSDPRLLGIRLSSVSGDN